MRAGRGCLSMPLGASSRLLDNVCSLRDGRRFASHPKSKRMRLDNHAMSKAAGRGAACTSVLAPSQSPSTEQQNDPRGPLHAQRRPEHRLVDSDHNGLSYVPITSAVVYQRRLQSGMFHSIVELLHAPYAPHALTVLRDVLGYAIRVQDGVGAEAVVVGGRRRALLNAVHVQSIYEGVMHTIRRAVDEVKLLGDDQSGDSFRQLLNEVQSMQTFLDDTLGNEDRLSLVETSIGRGGLFALLRHQLVATSAVGLVDASVINLHHMRRLGGHDCIIQSGANNGEPLTRDVMDLSDLVEEELEELRNPTTTSVVTPEDTLHAMASCKQSRRFSVALSLYRQLTVEAFQQRCPLLQEHLSDAVATLAESVHDTEDFRTLRHLLADSDVSAIPVTAALYGSLILSASRAVAEPQRMVFALSLYRRLRDAQIVPTPESYASLMAVCASMGDPTQAFAFYREALALNGGDASQFPPALFANLVLSYANAALFHDARVTLDVLMEANAPLTRSAFHAALSAAPSSRDAGEVLDLMRNVASIEPTPKTFGFLLAAEAKNPRGVDSLLHAHDVHSQCVHLVERYLGGSAIPERPTSVMGVNDYLVTHEPEYCISLERLCLNLSVDPSIDRRVVKYLQPMTAVVQQLATSFIGGLPPQRPTVLPIGSTVVVLAADVLADLDALIAPSMEYFSAVVIPHSSLALMRLAGARKEGKQREVVMPHGAGSADERSLLQHRRAQLCAFLRRYAAVTHIMSLEEELACSGDVSRYGIPIKALAARPAAVAMNLARGIATTTVYRQHQCTVVLATTRFRACGRFVKDQQARLHAEGGPQVYLWNPTYRPHWHPQGALSAEVLADSDQATDVDERDTALHAAAVHVAGQQPSDADILMDLLALDAASP